MAAGCAFSITTTTAGLTSSSRRTHAGRNAPRSGNRIYNNNRNSTFTDVTTKSGLIDRDGEQGWAQSARVSDDNNNGCENLFLTYYGQNRLYRNNGDGTFTNVTAEAYRIPKLRYSTDSARLPLQILRFGGRLDWLSVCAARPPTSCSRCARARGKSKDAVPVKRP